MPRESMRVPVDSPTAQILPFGLLSASVVIDSSDPHEMAGTNWMSYICGEAGVTDWCVPELEESPGESPGEESPGSSEKSFNRPESETGPSIVIYYGAECSAVGYDFSEAQDHAQLGLSLGEAKTLEQWVMHEILSRRAVDVTGGPTPLSLAPGVAAVESALASRFGGMGIIHAPAGVAALLGQSSQLIQDGGGCAADGTENGQESLSDFVPGRVRTPCGTGYHTWLGHRVALGAGYQSNLGPLDDNGVPTMAPPGSAWIYASGPVVIRRSDVIIRPPDSASSFNTRSNDRNVVAERGFVVEVSCAVVAALVDITCCC